MKILYYLIPILCIVALASCNDLDTEPIGPTLTEDQRENVIKDQAAKLQATVSGVYGNFYAWGNVYDNEQDFGVPAIITMLNQRTEGQVASSYDYGWFAPCGQFADNTPGSLYARIIWGTYYNTIYSANQVMEIVDKDTTDPTLRYYMAQALGARAYSYWMLAQLWQFNYSVDPNAPCVPIVTENNSEEAALNGVARASVKDVYAQIMADLSTAVEYMDGNTVTREDKRYMDLSVLYGLRARANLCMQNYEDAYDDAMTAIQLTSARPLSANEVSVPGFNNVSDPNWMWGIVIEEPDAHGLYTYAGFMGSFTYGYAYAGQWQLINSRLYDKIPEGDVRKGWWIAPQTRTSIADNYSATIEGLTASQYLDAVEAPDYAVVKFAPYGNVLQQSTNCSDVPLMRVEEMYLIAAEAKAMTDASAGKALLEQFVNTLRWDDPDSQYVCQASTAESIRDEIFFQRQIELWGEGFEYIDRLRLNKGLDRRNANFNPDWAFNIPAQSAVLLYQIPQAEIEGNPGISSADQNPSGSASL